MARPKKEIKKDKISSVRMTQQRYDEIMSVYGSVQKFFDLIKPKKR